MMLSEICSEDSRLLIECLLSGQMSVRQFIEHCEESPELLEILKVLSKRYERCGYVYCDRGVGEVNRRAG